MNLATIYLAGVSILIVGWLWFFVVRPIVMDIRDAIASRRARTAPADTSFLMSRSLPRRRYRRAHRPVAATLATPELVIAKPGNAINESLPGNAPVAPLPDEVRDIIRMQAKAEAVVELLTAKKMTNKAEAIEVVFKCKRTSRPNSTYQQALALVDPLIERYPPRTPEQKGARQELGLPA